MTAKASLPGLKIPAAVTAILSCLIFTLVSPRCVYPQALPVPQGTKCVECGMTVDGNSRFASEAVTNDGKKLFFCDIGDMLIHFKSDKAKLKTLYVKDYLKGDWIDGGKAFYVFNKKFSTPMSWSIAAFSDEQEAKKWGSPVGLSGAYGLLK